MNKTEWLVYWLYDDTCSDRAQHGCIGTTKATRLYARLNQHQKSKRIPKGFSYEIIFRGTQEAALALEAELRPKPHIGWNIGVGGFADGAGLKGVPKSPETREKMRLAALARFADPAELERLSEVVKKGRAEGKDQSGANNPMFGKSMSEETKEKIRERITERGGMSGANNPMFGRKRTEEEKRNISEGVKRAGPLTDEQRQRQREHSQRGDDHWRNRQD